MSGKLLVATAAVLALTGCGSSSPTTQDRASGGVRGPPSNGPNIVVVMSDDQDAASFGQAMPRTRRLARTGTTFTDFVVTTPSCCPSRATFITGEYGHNNGVLANVPGYPDLIQKENVLPAWLRWAGYRTAEFGKFMNGYENFATAMGALRGPGWDHWEALLPPYAYFDYDLSINNVRRHFGARERDYVDRVLTQRAVRFIRANRSARRPFFAWLNLYAPHAAPAGAQATCREVQRQRDPRAGRREPLQARRAPHPTVLRRTRCLRQALLRPGSAAGGPAKSGEAQPLAGLPPGLGGGRRPLRGADPRRAAEDRPARQHGPGVHLRQWLARRPASPARQGGSLRRGGARAPGRLGAAQGPGRGVGAQTGQPSHREHRSRAHPARDGIRHALPQSGQVPGHGWAFPAATAQGPCGCLATRPSDPPRIPGGRLRDLPVRGCANHPPPLCGALPLRPGGRRRVRPARRP